MMVMTKVMMPSNDINDDSVSVLRLMCVYANVSVLHCYTLFVQKERSHCGNVIVYVREIVIRTPVTGVDLVDSNLKPYFHFYFNGNVFPQVVAKVI